MGNGGREGVLLITLYFERLDIGVSILQRSLYILAASRHCVTFYMHMYVLESTMFKGHS